MKTKTPRVAKNKVYLASIKVLGKKYEAKGSSAKEAIGNLKVGNVAKGMSVLEITKGKVSKSKILNHPQTFRLFTLSKLMREVALKQVSLMFDGI